MYSWVGRINIIKMSILPKAIYRFNAIPIKTPMMYFTELEKIFQKFIWNHKRPCIVIVIQRKKMDSFLISYTKNNSEWSKDLIVRPETVKLLKENTREEPHAIRLVNDFIDMTPKAQATKQNKRKQSQWDYIRLNSFCTVKATNRVKRQPIDGRTYLQTIYLMS